MNIKHSKHSRKIRNAKAHPLFQTNSNDLKQLADNHLVGEVSTKIGKMTKLLTPQENDLMML